MHKITLRRILRSGWLSFRRNEWLSAATILVMVLVLFVLGNLIFIGAIANTLLASFESKIDVTIYFTTDAPEVSILQVKEAVESLPEVAETDYVSKEQALAQFRERHKTNAQIADALNELGDNPLEASLNIRAEDPSQYASISDFLLKKNYPIVDKINYFENQAIIERLGSIIKTIRGSGALLAVFLAFIAVLVAFNTIRLAIYTMREEISIMRLVGATQWFIRGPFVISGVLYGMVAALATILLFFPLAWIASPKVNILVPNFNLFQYFLSNIFEFFAILLFSGILLGTLSSMIAIRRYLRV